MTPTACRAPARAPRPAASTSCTQRDPNSSAHRALRVRRCATLSRHPKSRLGRRSGRAQHLVCPRIELHQLGRRARPPGLPSAERALEHEDSSKPTQQDRGQTKESTEAGADPDGRGLGGPAPPRSQRRRRQWTGRDGGRRMGRRLSNACKAVPSDGASRHAEQGEAYSDEHSHICFTRGCSHERRSGTVERQRASPGSAPGTASPSSRIISGPHSSAGPAPPSIRPSNPRPGRSWTMPTLLAFGAPREDEDSGNPSRRSQLTTDPRSDQAGDGHSIP